MKGRHAQIPRHSLLEDAGLQWPGASAVMFYTLSAEDILSGTTPANDVESSSCRKLPSDSEKNLLKVAREYRRLFGSTQPRGRLGGDIGRLIFGRRARPIY